MALLLGAKAPDFDLPGVDGKNHSLKELTDRKALVIIFSCNHCPYVQAYEDRIIAIQQDYASKGVAVVAINANEDRFHPEDSFPVMVKRAHEKNFNFIYLRDQTQSVANAYQATHTPHVYLFNGVQELVYTGKIDDNWQEPLKVVKRYLRAGLDAVLAGLKPSEPETYAIGCTIKWL